MRVIFVICLFVSCFTRLFAQALPNMDIFISDISGKENNKVFSKPENITQRNGYDNQPNFSSDGKKIYFTSIRDSVQADMYVFDINSKLTAAICNTAESEFSPMSTPDQKGISTIRIDKDSSQHFWIFPKGKCEPEMGFNGLDSVGYYCWLNNTNAAFFIVSEPPRLIIEGNEYANPRICKNIGRCIKKVPGMPAISFIEKIEPWLWVIRMYNYETKKYSFLIQAPMKAEDYEWLSDGTLIIGSEGKLLKFKPGTDTKWSVAVDLSMYITDITRIAVNADGTRIAIAAVPLSQP